MNTIDRPHSRYRGQVQSRARGAGGHALAQASRPVFLMWLTSVCETVGCPMLGLGIAPRIAAVAFALFILLVSLLFLRFWTSRPDTPDFLLRWNNFFGNLAMTLLYVVVAGSLFADLIAGIKEEQQS